MMFTSSRAGTDFLSSLLLTLVSFLFFSQFKRLINLSTQKWNIFVSTLFNRVYSNIKLIFFSPFQLLNDQQFYHSWFDICPSISKPSCIIEFFIQRPLLDKWCIWSRLELKSQCWLYANLILVLYSLAFFSITNCLLHQILWLIFMLLVLLLSVCVCSFLSHNRSINCGLLAVISLNFMILHLF